MNNATNPTAVIPFSFESKEVRSMNINGDPWFVAADVCAILGIVNPTQAVGQLDDDERAMQNIGRQGDANIISESGLYALVFRSNKPQAKPFRKWVTSEVLPAIRKTGKYQQAAPTDTLLALSGSEFRTVFFNDIALTIFTDEDDSQWFRAKDLGQILGKNRSSGADTAYIKNLVRDGATRMLRPTIDGKAYCPSVFIDQTGLEEVIMRSTCPTVKPFSRFIMKVVSGAHAPARLAPSLVPVASTPLDQALQDRLMNSRFMVSFGPNGEAIFEEVLGYRVGMKFHDVPVERAGMDTFFRRSELHPSVVAELPRV